MHAIDPAKRRRLIRKWLAPLCINPLIRGLSIKKGSIQVWLKIANNNVYTKKEPIQMKAIIIVFLSALMKGKIVIYIVGVYLKSITENILPSERETLTKIDRYNEYVMTGLRTIWGISLDRIETEFGKTYLDYLNKQSYNYIEDHFLFVDDNILRTTKTGKFLSDGIASDLFMLN